MAWYSAYDKIKPYLFRISTEMGFGTGFLFAFNKDHSIAAIATAAHVIAHDHSWSKPIKIGHYETRSVVLFKEQERVTWVDNERDSATMLVFTDRFSLPATPLPIMSPEKYKKIGVEVGWVGFPAICPLELCFFSGKISCFLGDENSYLIDGVAINGVSGGPVFGELADSTPEIIGIVSAYMPNRRAADTSPGLLKAQDLTSYQEHIQRIQSFDEAKAKEIETQQEMNKPDKVCE
jgi:hypothetical protein